MKRNTFLAAVAAFLLLAGTGLLLYPTIHARWDAWRTGRAVQTFRGGVDRDLHLSDASASTETEPVGSTEEASVPYPELLQAMADYNKAIYLNGQSDLCDPWAYQVPVFDFAEYGIEDDIVGILSIPKMDLELPIYLGATAEHLASGAAQLSQTSMPIGGTHTNCVLAGHRGWYGAPFFRHIELLEIGDEVSITNLWETLTYTVSEIQVIEPNEIAKILIQPGRDLVTLLTCHPYGSGGRYRYVVYCERKP